MSLIKWEPFDEFDRIFRDIPQFPTLRLSNIGLDLAADVYEDGTHLIAEMNLPGLKGENINVEVEDNHLRISGKREEVEEKKTKNHYAREIRRGTFERVIPLPSPVEQGKVEAEYKNGVLKVTMPKKRDSGHNKVKVRVK